MPGFRNSDSKGRVSRLKKKITLPFLCSLIPDTLPLELSYSSLSAVSSKASQAPQGETNHIKSFVDGNNTKRVEDTLHTVSLKAWH